MVYLIVFIAGVAVGKIPAAGWVVGWQWLKDLAAEVSAAAKDWAATRRAKRK